MTSWLVHFLAGCHIQLWMDEIHFAAFRNPGMSRFPCAHQQTFWFPMVPGSCTGFLPPPNLRPATSNPQPPTRNLQPATPPLSPPTSGEDVGQSEGPDLEVSLLQRQLHLSRGRASPWRPWRLGRKSEPETEGRQIGGPGWLQAQGSFYCHKNQLLRTFRK